MAITNNTLTSIFVCMDHPILMGDDTPIEVIFQGKVEIPHGILENILNVAKL
jgi:hypothetical protein